MTIRLLKELISDLPDNMRIYADDGTNGTFDDNNEFLTLVTNGNMCVFQTREDIDTVEELKAWCKRASEENWQEVDFWMEFAERGYVPADFSTNGVDEEKEQWADENLRNYGLV